MVYKPFLIGVDPDTAASGVCLYRRLNMRYELIAEMRFFVLYDLLRMNAKSVHVIIEAGWINKLSNWHTDYINKDGQRISIPERAQYSIARKTGSNHETGRKIVEMCEYLSVPYQLYRPYKKKVGIEQFRSFTGVTQKLTQDMVDACMLVYGK